MIIFMFCGGVLFARNSIAGQPRLQQRLVNLIVFTGFFSDVRLPIDFQALPWY
jgi:hypothetical protein